MSEIKKGRITTIKNGTVLIESATGGGDVSTEITVPQSVDISSLKKGMHVAYVVFEDYTGVIVTVF